MNCLVIGGTRNLGPAVVAAFLADGHRVAVLNRGITPDDLPGAVERIRADRTDAAAFRRALAGRSFDAVVDTTLYDGAGAHATAALLDGRVGRYLFISSGQVYLVRDPVPRPFREEDYDGAVTRPPSAGTRDHEEWRYGVGKREAEDAFQAAWRARGFPFTSLRLPMVNSERDHYSRIHGYLLRLRDGGPIVIPDGSHLALRHVYGGDVVRAITAALKTESAAGRAYNIAQDETLSLEEFLSLLAGIAGCPLRLRRVGRDALERRGLIPDCSPFSDPWMSELDNQRSKTELGLAYTPLAEYVRRIVARYDAAPPSAPEGYRRRREELALAAES